MTFCPPPPADRRAKYNIKNLKKIIEKYGDVGKNLFGVASLGSIELTLLEFILVIL